MLKSSEFSAENKDDFLHVFIIHNPVSIIMSLMIKDHLNLSDDDILAVSHRNTSTEHTGFKEVRCVIRPLDRYINRITGRNMSGLRLRRTLEAHGRPYIVYCAWIFPEVEELLHSSSCKGHYLVEEGQQSYYPSKTYKHNFFNSWRFRKNKILAGQIDYYFRDDAIGGFCLDGEGFPFLPDRKKTVLNNLAEAAKTYTPQLEGVRSIGLMPAPRRLPPDMVWPAVQTLINSFETKGVIKFHPGFKSEPQYSATIYDEKIRSMSNGRVGLCPDEILLELEMLTEPKKLYGARSSLVRYARKLGSEFSDVVFEGYIKPKN